MNTPSALFRAAALRTSKALRSVFTAKPANAPLNEPSSDLGRILIPGAMERWSLPRVAQMTPQMIEVILTSALTSPTPDREQELYSLMESTWPRLAKNLNEVKEGVLSLDWTLMDAVDGQVPGAKELMDRTRNGMRGDPITGSLGWRGMLAALLDGYARGVSLVQLQWEWRDGGSRWPGAWLPKEARDIPARHFGWDDAGIFRLYPDANTMAPVEVPRREFLVAIRQATKGHACGGALLRSLAWWWASANFCQEWLLNFAQIFGQPFRWATYDASSPGAKEELAAMMAAMGSAAWGVGRDGTKIEWHESAKNGADNPQAYMLALADKACDLLVLGQTLTTDVGSSGSRALGDVHQSVRADIIDGAAAWLAEILNEQLITAVVAMNFGEPTEDAALPYFQPARKNVKDTKQTAEIFKLVLDAGIPLKKNEVYDALDLGQPGVGEEVFGGIAASSGVSGAILTALAAAGLRVTDTGISQLSDSVGISIERAPTGDGGAPAEASPEIRRLLAKLPLDAREYIMARLVD